MLIFPERVVSLSCFVVKVWGFWGVNFVKWLLQIAFSGSGNGEMVLAKWWFWIVKRWKCGLNGLRMWLEMRVLEVCDGGCLVELGGF